MTLVSWNVVNTHYHFWRSVCSPSPSTIDFSASSLLSGCHYEHTLWISSQPGKAQEGLKCFCIFLSPFSPSFLDVCWAIEVDASSLETFCANCLRGKEMEGRHCDLLTRVLYDRCCFPHLILRPTVCDNNKYLGNTSPHATLPGQNLFFDESEGFACKMHGWARNELSQPQEKKSLV